MRDAAFPRGKLACDSPWPLGLSTSVPLVPAHVLLFFFSPRGFKCRSALEARQCVAQP